MKPITNKDQTESYAAQKQQDRDKAVTWFKPSVKHFVKANLFYLKTLTAEIEERTEVAPSPSEVLGLSFEYKGVDVASAWTQEAGGGGSDSTHDWFGF